MIGKTERVILVKGDASKWYNQAIFIVNKNVPTQTMPIDFVAEAEKIIHEYNLKHTNETIQPIKRKNYPRNILMILACVAIAAILTFGWLR